MHVEYDIIVVGGGHAGCEAAAAAANLGSSTLMITMDLTRIAQMSCNPAMGGIAKGQIIREVDALGGYSGIVSDKSAIQFRMLNRSKGPAMWSPRTQNDRMLFAQEWRILLEQTPNVDFWQETVIALLIKNGRIRGVKTSLGLEIRSKTVILTSGTFLNGLIHIGEKQFGGGRAGENASVGITEQLTQLGFDSGRMKTGTPPRVDGRSLDYSKMEVQHGDEKVSGFSYLYPASLTNQKCCHITYTNTEVHEELQKGFDRSPMFNGRIQATGPRYCPSIEDKIDRFADKDQHQLFVEPEGWNTVEIYLNGFSTSLPEEVQLKALRKIEGFANAKIFRPGYAIEYDYFPPTQLTHTLETKLIPNLYFAGQVNGTTGYEEAACQGIIAGINAHQKINEKDPFVLNRDEAYIGVLIDDLITKGTEEPYRMFTSRAEYRILLRQDNADERLTPLAHQLGLASDERMNKVELKRNATKEVIGFLHNQSVSPEEINPALEKLGTNVINQKVKMERLVTRPQVHIADLVDGVPSFSTFLSDEDKYSDEVLEQVEIQIKYEGYISKEREIAEKMSRLDDITIPVDLNYNKLESLSTEAKEKLSAIRPAKLGQASRISGVSPADIAVLMIYLGR